MKSNCPSFADGMILYIEDPKDSIRRLSDVLNTSTMLQDLKKKQHVKISSIYINNELVEEEIWKNREFTVTSKNI